MVDQQEPELIEHRGETYYWDGTRLDRLPNKREIALLELKAALAKYFVIPVFTRLNRLLLWMQR